jgi:hypothetical protein
MVGDNKDKDKSENGGYDVDYIQKNRDSGYNHPKRPTVKKKRIKKTPKKKNKTVKRKK